MNITALIDRYFEGETSIEEERSLKAYFLEGPVAEQHKQYADLFLCFAEEATISYEGQDSIDLLLEKYFEGESSIEEEQALKAYYSEGEVREEHKIYADLFTLLTSEATLVYKGTDSIDLLLEKYFAGETDLEEEKRIKSYFQNGDVAEEHKVYGDLFGFYADAQTEQLEKDINLQKGRRLVMIRRAMMGIAASLAILLGSLYVMNLNQEASMQEMTAMEEAEAEEALETTMEALAYLGIQFNKGTESLEQLEKLKKTEIFKN